MLAGFAIVLALLRPLATRSTTTAAATAAPAARPPATLFSEMGDHRHPIATKSPEAQRFFDQGLTLLYGFNHEEAIRSFEHAAELDPKAAMPHWGMALGARLELQRPGSRRGAAARRAPRSRRRSRSRPARPRERAGLRRGARGATRPIPLPTRRLAARLQRGDGGALRRYPDDLDAATLYAESGMNLQPLEALEARRDAGRGDARRSSRCSSRS